MEREGVPAPAHPPTRRGSQPLPFAPRSMAHAIRAIEHLMRGDPEEHQRTFDYLKTALDQHRTEGNKLFP